MTFVQSICTFLNLRQLLASATQLRSGEPAASLPETNTGAVRP